MTVAPSSAGPRRPGRVGRPATALALGSGLVLLIVLGLAARTTPESPVTRVPSFLITPPPAVPPPQQSPAPTLPPVGAALATVLEVLLALAVLALVAAVVLVVVLAVRAVAGRERPAGIEDAEPSVVDLDRVGVLLERSRAEIDVEGDANLAVVRCWQGLELLAAEAGVPRAAHQTAREYTVAVLTGASLPSGPIGRLADLYAEALFSDRRLPERARRAAVAALDDLRAAADAAAGGADPVPEDGSETSGPERP